MAQKNLRSLCFVGRSEAFDEMNWMTVLAGLISGFIGALGLGGGGVLLMYLTLFTDLSQRQAGGINLLFFLPVGLVAVIIHAIKKQIEWKTVFKMWLGGAVGVAVGTLLAHKMNTDILSKIFAAALIVFGIYLILGDFIKADAKKSKQ